jgi:hypothetical protein
VLYLYASRDIEVDYVGSSMLSGRPVFPVNPVMQIDISAWRSAQTLNFCLAARLLAEYRLSYPNEPYYLHRDAQLCTLKWFLLNGREPSLTVEREEGLVVVLHTLANRAVGLFAMELRSAFKYNHTGGPTMDGISFPPDAVPTHELMKLPDPYSQDCVQAFTKCHLPAMTDPAFLTSEDWTGYFSFTDQRRFPALPNSHDVFDSIGGDNHLVRYNGFDKPNSNYPFVVERTCRFNLVNMIDEHSFLLESNCFQSQLGTHIFEMRVNRRNGVVYISQRNHDGILKGEFMAVMTPFGIVGGCAPLGAWMWLWKSKWSADS